MAAVADEEVASLGTSAVIERARTDGAIVTEPTPEEPAPEEPPEERGDQGDGTAGPIGGERNFGGEREIPGPPEVPRLRVRPRSSRRPLPRSLPPRPGRPRLSRSLTVPPPTR